MQMPIGTVLEWKYPTADGSIDYRVQDDGSGPYIAYWNEQKLGPQPTTEQLLNWWLDAEKWAKRGEFSRRALTEIKKLYPHVASVDGGWVADALLDVASNHPNAATISAIKGKRGRAYTTVDGTTGATVEEAVANVRALTWESIS